MNVMMLPEDVIKLCAIHAGFLFFLKRIGNKFPARYPPETKRSLRLINTKILRDVVRTSLHLMYENIIKDEPRSEKLEKHVTRILFGKLDA